MTSLGKRREVVTGMAQVDRRGRSLYRWQLRYSKKGGCNQKARGGQGTKLMVVADDQGIPLEGCLCSVSPAGVTLVAFGFTRAEGVDPAFDC